jgi:hypothetical protein
MNPATLLLALAVLQEGQAPTPPAPDERALQKKIAQLELKLERLETRIREDVDRGDAESARRHNQEYREAEQELEGVRRDLAKLQGKQPARLEWYENFNLEAQALLTRWDNDLELEDGVGWGAALYVRDFLFFEYRRWETDDELGDDDATVQSYEVGFTYEFGLAPEKRSAFILGGGVGLVHFSTGAAGRDGDTGPVVSFTPQWKFYFSRAVRLNVGLDVDLLRTDFNQNHTHTNHTFSLLGSIEFAF